MSKEQLSKEQSNPSEADAQELKSAKGLDTTTIMDFSKHENFPVAAWFLPSSVKSDLLTIYGFARLVDQIGDEAPGDRGALLDELTCDLDRAYTNTAHHPILRSLSPTIHRHQIPKDLFLRLIEANRLDQRLRRIKTHQELLDYCELSANPVGELVLYVFEQWTEQKAQWSDSVCSALQIVEHCQDVAEDLDQDRVYLPAEDLAACECPVDSIGLSPAPEPLRRAIEMQVGRARKLLSDGRPLVSGLRGWARPAVAAFTAGGLATCDALEAAGFDPNSAPVRPKKWRILVNTLTLLLRSRRPE